MKTTIAILLFFQHEFAFCTKQQINGTIVRKKNNKEKLHLQLLLVLMLLPSRLLNQPQPMKKDTMKSNTNVAFYVQIEIYKTQSKTITNTKTDINLNFELEEDALALNE
jgi:hypothetical protein